MSQHHKPPVYIGAEPGIYEHYKGGLYKCHGVAVNPDKPGDELVFYTPLYITPDGLFGRMTYRSLDGLDGWRTPVAVKDLEGVTQIRFRRIADNV